MMLRYILFVLSLNCASVILCGYEPASSVSSNTNQMTSASGLTSEVQYRPGFLNPWVYPLVEIFLTNQTNQTIECKRASLDGVELVAGGNCIWRQFYPCEKVMPGQTALLQICLADAPEKPEILGIETQRGQQLSIKLDPFPPRPNYLLKTPREMSRGKIPSYDLSKISFPVPSVRITGITFSQDFKRAFILFSALPNGLSPKQVFFDGKNCEKGIHVVNISSEELPRFAGSAGMIAAKVPDAASQGKPIHVRVQFSDGSVAQELLRAWKGIFLDDFGIEEGEKGEKLRRELSLDVAPSFKTLPCDPACDDFNANRHGKAMPAILETRKKWYEAASNLLCYPYLCVASIQETYSVYAQCAVGIQVNPYRLQWSGAEKFIEEEAKYFRWGREAACPKPWFWIPEVFTVKGLRIIEAPEYRLAAYTALANAVKGMRFFIYGSGAGWSGYEKSPSLLAEIKKINGEIKKLEPILGPALFISKKTIGGGDTGCRQYTLWSGDDGVLTIVRTLDYTTDREPNDFGKKPRFKYTPKTKVPVVIRKPFWFKEAASQGATKLSVIDPLTGQVFPYQEDAETIQVELPKLDLAQVLWIPTPTK